MKHGTKVAIVLQAEPVRRVDDYAIEREVNRSTAVRELGSGVVRVKAGQAQRCAP